MRVSIQCFECYHFLLSVDSHVSLHFLVTAVLTSEINLNFKTGHWKSLGADALPKDPLQIFFTTYFSGIIFFFLKIFSQVFFFFFFLGCTASLLLCMGFL